PMAATTTPTATMLTAWRPKRRCSRAPNAALTIAPHNGTNGIRKSQPASTSLLERRHVVRVDGSEVAEDGEHDGERDRRLRRREHDDEQREHHAADGAGDEVRERHEVERRGVEDELDAHEDGDRVAPRGHGEEAEREQRRRHDEEMLEADHGASFRVARGSCGSRGSCVARRAITIAPTSAMSSTSDASSNGKSSSCRNASPSRAVSGAGTASVVGHGVCTATRAHNANSAIAGGAPRSRPADAFEMRTSPMRLVRSTANKSSTRMPPT